jgi:hypothetical protein
MTLLFRFDAFAGARRDLLSPDSTRVFRPLLGDLLFLYSKEK